MTFADLKMIVKRGEGQNLEFKKKADHPEKIVREMVAFANSSGGMLLLGVDDNGTISGLKYPEEEKYAMEAAMALYVKPELKYSLQSIKTELGREVLVYRISEGVDKPYFWLFDKPSMTYKAYVRNSDQSLQASSEMLKILKFESKEIAKPLTFTPREMRIFSYLEVNKVISLQEFSRIAKIPKWIASRILVQWVVQGIFEIQPGEQFDLYTLSDSYNSEK